MSDQLKCIIVDDEIKGRRVLKSICEDYCPNVTIIGEADSAEKAEIIIKKMNPDFIFLDIRMPMKDGFQLLELFEDRQFDVIFTTAYDQYAVQAFRFSAIDYLLKPIDIDDLVAAVKKIETQQFFSKDQRIENLKQNLKNAKPSKLAFATSDGFIFVEQEHIIRCEAYGNYTRIHLDNSPKPVLISKTLKYFEGILSDFEYFRIHKSHLVNLTHVVKFVKGKPAKLIMSDNSEVEVSIRKREELIKTLID